MWSGIDGFLRGRSRLTIMLFGVAMVCLLGVVEILTGHEISFSIFYLVPIIMVGWYGGRMPGVALAVLTALVWYYADLASGHLYSNRAIAVWNAGMRLGILVVAVFFISENRRLLDAEQTMARTDSVTLVANSRHFLEILEQELKRSDRTGKPVTLVYLDVDNFKIVNDLQGHGSGNLLLSSVADMIRHHIRDIDTVGRLGGDEFAIVLPETGELEARGMISRVQERLRSAMAVGVWPVTFSYGVMTCYNGASTVEELVKRADALMYESKNAGKDRITFGVMGLAAPRA